MKLSSFWEVLRVFISPPAPEGGPDRSEHTRADARFAAGDEKADPQPRAQGRRGVSKRIPGGSRVRDGEARRIVVS